MANEDLVDSRKRSAMAIQEYHDLPDDWWRSTRIRHMLHVIG